MLLSKILGLKIHVFIPHVFNFGHQRSHCEQDKSRNVFWSAQKLLMKNSIQWGLGFETVLSYNFSNLETYCKKTISGLKKPLIRPSHTQNLSLFLEFCLFFLSPTSIPLLPIPAPKPSEVPEKSHQCKFTTTPCPVNLSVCVTVCALGRTILRYLDGNLTSLFLW